MAVSTNLRFGNASTRYAMIIMPVCKFYVGAGVSNDLPGFDSTERRFLDFSLSVCWSSQSGMRNPSRSNWLSSAGIFSSEVEGSSILATLDARDIMFVANRLACRRSTSTREAVPKPTVLVTSGSFWISTGSVALTVRSRPCSATRSPEWPAFISNAQGDI